MVQSLSWGNTIVKFGSSGYGHSGSKVLSVVVLLGVVVGTVIVEVIVLEGRVLLVGGASVVVVGAAVVEFPFSHPACSG